MGISGSLLKRPLSRFDGPPGLPSFARALFAGKFSFSPSVGGIVVVGSLLGLDGSGGFMHLAAAISERHSTRRVEAFRNSIPYPFVSYHRHQVHAFPFQLHNILFDLSVMIRPSPFLKC